MTIQQAISENKRKRIRCIIQRGDHGAIAVLSGQYFYAYSWYQGKLTPEGSLYHFTVADLISDDWHPVINRGTL